MVQRGSVGSVISLKKVIMVIVAQIAYIPVINSADNLQIQSMKKPQSSLSLLLLLALLTLYTQQYALQGAWTLTNNQDIKLDPSIPIQFQFTETITPDLTISKTLIVHACYDLAYSYSVDENNIYINFLNIIDIPRKCMSGEITTIKAKLDTVFYFIINGTSLTLYDPTGFAPFVFQNADSNVGPAINGGWQTLKINQNIQNKNVYINGSHAVLCNGNGIAIYNITSRSQVIFTILRSRGCDSASMDILSALDSTVFYRIRNSTYLYLYDYALNNVLYAYMTSFVGFRQSLNFVSQTATQNLTLNQSNVMNATAPAATNSTIVTVNKTQVQAIAVTNSSGAAAQTSKQNQTQAQANTNVTPTVALTKQNSTLTTVSTPVTPVPVPTLAKSSINSSASTSASTTIPSTVPPISTQTPIPSPSNSTPNPLPTPTPATPIQQSSSLTTQSSNSQQVPPQKPSNPLPAAPTSTTSTPQKIISSVSDFSALNSKLIDGKWFISVLPGQSISSPLKTYYFIANSSAKRFIMYGGCNVQFYLYTLNGNQITFGSPTSTAKVCTPNNDSIVTNPLFKNSVYLQAAAGTLTFYDSQFAQTIVLTTTPPS